MTEARATQVVVEVLRSSDAGQAAVEVVAEVLYVPKQPALVGWPLTGGPSTAGPDPTDCPLTGLDVAGHFRVTYATVSLMTCETVETWTEDVYCSLSQLQRHTVSKNTCVMTAVPSGVGAAECCCDGDTADLAGTGSPPFTHTVESSTFNMQHCTLVGKTCEPLEVCDEPVYTVYGGGCWFDATNNAYASPAPLFPDDKLYMYVGTPGMGIHNGKYAMENVLSGFGVPLPLQLDYVAENAIDFGFFGLSNIQTGPNSRAYQYVFSSNLNYLTDTPPDTSSNGLYVVALFYANDIYSVTGTGTGTGDYVGCFAMCKIGYYRSGGVGFQARTFGGFVRGSSPSYSVFQFYPEPIRIEFEPLAFETEPPYNDAPLSVGYSGVVVFDLDVPPIRTYWCATPPPDTLTADITGLVGLHSLVNGTYTLTYQYGLWVGTATIPWAVGTAKCMVAFYPGQLNDAAGPFDFYVGVWVYNFTVFAPDDVVALSFNSSGSINSSSSPTVTCSPFDWTGKYTSDVSGEVHVYE